jgi:hypothetical protein
MLWPGRRRIKICCKYELWTYIWKSSLQTTSKTQVKKIPVNTVLRITEDANLSELFLSS